MSCHFQLSANHVMSQWEIILIDTRLFVRVFFVHGSESNNTGSFTHRLNWEVFRSVLDLCAGQDVMGLLENEVVLVLY